MARHYGCSHARDEPVDGCCGSCARSSELRVLRSLLKRNELKACFYSRIAYAPMAVKNYGFGGLTPVNFRTFAPCSLIGDFPNTVLFTHLGGSVDSIVAALDGKEALGTAPKIGLAISITGTVIILVVVGYYVRRELRDEEARMSLRVAAPRVVPPQGRAARVTREGMVDGNTRRV